MGDAPRLLRTVLTPLAARYDLDYNTESLAPGETFKARAYSLLCGGAWLLVLGTEPDDFPANSKRTRKRGAKRLARAFSTPSGGDATMFLAQALGVYVAEAMREADEGESAEAHMRMVALLDSYYPIPVEFRERFEAAADRLRRLESATPYSPTGDFEPTYDDHDAQVMNAWDSYRQTMTFEGISIAIGDDLHSLGDLRYPRADIDYEAVIRMRADARWWTDAAEDWGQAASAALRGTVAEE